MAITFDDMDTPSGAGGREEDSYVYQPFWALDRSDKDQVLNWLKFNLDRRKQEAVDRVEEYRGNIARYKNLYYYDLDSRDSREGRASLSGSTVNRRYKKLSVNHLRDLVNARVARLTRFKPAIAVTPPTTENEDELAAGLAKRWVDYLWYTNNVEALNAKHAKVADLFGESFVWPVWNENKGPVDPDYLDDDAEAEDEDGETVKLKGKPRMGEIEYKLISPEYVHLDDMTEFTDCRDCFIEEYFPIAELKADFPNSADEIQSEPELDKFNYDRFEQEPVHHQSRKITYMYRPDHYFPEGVEIVFTVDVILRERDYPYCDPNDPEETFEVPLPLVRFTSDEVPGDKRAVSFVRYIRNLQDIYNSLTTMITRNQLMAAHPKWIMPAGAANLKSLGNDLTVVQYKGPTPPQLVSFKTTSNEVFEFRNQIKEEMQQLSGIYGVSRGEPPAGVKAGVALQFLSEQEQERFNSQVVKWQQYIVDLADWTIRLIGLYYEKDDKRKLQIVGTDTGMDGEIIEFDPEVFKRKFNIRMQKSSALPESKAARSQTALDIKEIAPNTMSDEDLVEILDIGNVKKFQSKITVNKAAADFETQKIKEGHSTEAPEPYENHLVHYDQHLTAMSDKGFHKWPKSRKKALQDHIMAHEMFMYRISKKSEQYAAEIGARFPMFPLFFPIQKLEEALQAESQLVQPVTSPEQGLPPQPIQTQAPLEGVPSEEIPLPPLPPEGDPIPEGVNAATLTT